jgi:hypothetical protein
MRLLATVFKLLPKMSLPKVKNVVLDNSIIRALSIGLYVLVV